LYKHKIQSVLLKQKKRPTLDITGFFFLHSYSGQGLCAAYLGFQLSTQAENETLYIQYGPLLLFK